MESLPILGNGNEGYYVIIEADSGTPLHRTRDLDIACELWNPGTFFGKSKSSWKYALRNAVGAVNRRRKRLKEIEKYREKLARTHTITQ
jgi:hypothetical protein